jgi:hypothetical protein
MGTMGWLVRSDEQETTKNTERITIAAIKVLETVHENRSRPCLMVNFSPYDLEISGNHAKINQHEFLRKLQIQFNRIQNLT